MVKLNLDEELAGVGDTTQTSSLRKYPDFHGGPGGILPWEKFQNTTGIKRNCPVLNSIRSVEQIACLHSHKALLYIYFISRGRLCKTIVFMILQGENAGDRSKCGAK